MICMRGLDKNILHPAVSDGMKIVLMIGDVRLAAEEVGVAGDVYILDASVATPNHFAKFTPAIVKKFLVCVQVREMVEFAHKKFLWGCTKNNQHLGIV